MGPFPSSDGFGAATKLDSSDPLRNFRDRFVVTDPELIYLDGNSLGRAPQEALDLVNDVAQRQWSDRLIRSWNEGWWELQLRLGELLAPILGARFGEVIISDATSVNLFKLASAALSSRAGRRKIITDDLNFPTDIYVLDGVARLHDSEIVIVPSDGVIGPLAGLEAAMDEDTALVSLSHTTFKSGYTYDLKAVNTIAHEAGALVLWDASHSAGSVPIDFTESGTDLAIGCTYKYLNGGPGSPAFLYVRQELQDQLDNPIKAWWAHTDPFAFDLEFKPVQGIRRFHTGTMPVLSLAAIEPGIRVVAEAGITAIRSKSIRLTEFMIDQWETHLESLGFALGTPRDPSVRGSHVSLFHDDALRLSRTMIDYAKVIPDFRAPDSLRFGLSPLYIGFVDIHTAVQRIKTMVESEAHLKVDLASRPVT